MTDKLIGMLEIRVYTNNRMQLYNGNNKFAAVRTNSSKWT